MQALRVSNNYGDIPAAQSEEEFFEKFLSGINKYKLCSGIMKSKGTIQICYRFTKLETVKGTYNILRTGLYRDYKEWAVKFAQEYPEYINQQVKIVSYSGKSKNYGGDVIYFITDGLRKYVKIGYTNNLERRLSGLRVGNPYGIEVLGIMDGGVKEERNVHEMFSKNRYMGEWFELSSEIQDFINSDFVFRPDKTPLGGGICIVDINDD